MRQVISYFFEAHGLENIRKGTVLPVCFDKILYGGSTGVRRSLARIVTRRIRFSRPPPYKNTLNDYTQRTRTPIKPAILEWCCGSRVIVRFKDSAKYFYMVQ
jgi:hypothetical protein